MAKPKFDGVVEAVHYKPDGQVGWVRVYKRRGSAFSDRILLNRDKLIEELKSGKHYVSGKRIPLMAGTFEVSGSVNVVQNNGSEVLVTDDLQSKQDRLEGVPII